MPEFVVLGIILTALSGLYYAMYKNHGCIKRVESKLDAHFDAEFLKEEIIEIKDAIRQLK